LFPCTGDDVFARLAFSPDMRLGTAKSMQYSMQKTPLISHSHLPASLSFKDPEKRKRERRSARHEEGRVTAAKQARMRGCSNAVCVESASPSPTLGEQPGGGDVQATPFIGVMPATRSGEGNKIPRALPDTQVATSTPKDTIPADMPTSLPETPFMHFVQHNTLGLVVNW